MRNTSNRAAALALAAVLIFGASLISAPRPARADTVVCVNCSTVVQQLLQYLTELENTLTNIQTLQTQIRQYEDMIRQGLSWPSSLFQRLTSDLQALQNLYAQSRALAGNVANFDQRFRQQFPDYAKYLLNSAPSSQSMPQKYQQWAEQGFDAMRVAMQAAGMNVNSIAGEDVLLAQLVRRSQTSQGRLQAIQAGNEIAAQQVQQLQKLRELINADIQGKSAWYAQNVERAALDDAFRQRMRAGKVENSATKEF